MHKELMDQWEWAYLFLCFVLRHLPTPIVLPLVREDKRDEDTMKRAQVGLLRTPELLDTVRPLYGDDLADTATAAADRLIITYRLVTIVGETEAKTGGVTSAHGYLHRTLPHMIKEADTLARRAGDILRHRGDTWGE